MGAERLDAPEFKYTDRHVREDPDLRTWAEGYVRLYGGDFEPLLNAKRELFRADRLETRTARVVLNCARYDQNFAHQLPLPKSPSLELVKTVQTLGPFCDDPRPHRQHSEIVNAGRKSKLLTCPGVPWEINRSIFWTDVKVKAEFCAATSSNIYHRATGEGWREWHPPMHEMGPAVAVDLVVDLVCLYPSKLHNPLLFAKEPTTMLSSIVKKPGYRTRCPNGCFNED